MSATDDLGRLQAIKHIVVLMLENRSFDHMLGYLKLAEDPLPVEGLDPGMSNPDGQGNEVGVFEFPPNFTAFRAPGNPTDETLDPCHDPKCVAEQLEGPNRGFVKNFLETHNPPPEHRTLPMGYFTDKHLPVYDYLARAFCVCDHWHSSIPGDTMPNRCYSIAGREGPTVTSQIDALQKLGWGGVANKLDGIPIYDLQAFTRQLRDEQWRWYSHDPASLRSVDGKYRSLFHLQRDNFRYFDRREISLELQAAELLFVGGSFLDDAANGDLREVSWIDPNFINLHVLDTSSDDDHPPSDVHAGQQLVLTLFQALVNSPGWQDTLLVVTYDEHGGFFDHVVPPPVEAGDGGKYRTYGVRVPAILIGPRVKNGVCPTFFDHTSLIATILRRFAADPEAAVAAMPTRVGRAAHLGGCLLDAPRPAVSDPHALAPKIAQLQAVIDSWRVPVQAARRARPLARAAEPGGAGRPQPLHDFQKDFVRFALTMRQLGLPAGEP